MNRLSNSNISTIGQTLANGANTNLENNGLLELNLSGSTGTLNQNLSTNNSSNVFGSTNNLVLDNANSSSKSNLNNVILLSDKRYYLFGNGTNSSNFKNGNSKSSNTLSNNQLPPLNILNAYPL